MIEEEEELAAPSSSKKPKINIEQQLVCVSNKKGNNGFMNKIDSKTCPYEKRIVKHNTILWIIYDVIQNRKFITPTIH